MEKTMAASQARQNFKQVLQDALRGDKTVVEWHGEPVAAVVPIEVYRQWQRERQRFFDLMRENSLRANLDEDEAMKLALEAQQAVRHSKKSG
jgi:prevent-host-death family protein